MNYEMLFKHEFESIINKYNMKYLVVDNNEFAIVGRNFALIFTIHLGDAFIRYVMPNEQGELEVYNFDSFIVEKFNATDREKIKISNTVEEKITNQFKIIAKGLINHWHKLLKGEKTWMEDYLKYELAGKPRKANKKIIDVIGIFRN